MFFEAGYFSNLADFRMVNSEVFSLMLEERREISYIIELAAYDTAVYIDYISIRNIYMYSVLG